MSIDIRSFQQTFFDEAGELLDEFEKNLLLLEEHPNDRELLNSIFRCAHSIKGGSATFGFPDVAMFTHSLETLLDELRNGRLEFTPSLSQLLLESLDHMRELLAACREGHASKMDSGYLIAKLMSAGAEAAENAMELSDNRSRTAEPFRLSVRPGPDTMRQGNNPIHILDSLRSLVEVTSIECNTFDVPPLEAIDPESCYLAWTISLITDRGREEILEPFEFIADDSDIELMTLDDFFGIEESDGAPVADMCEERPARASAPAAIREHHSPSKENGTIKVSSDKLDKLINLVGELIISQSMLNAVTQRLDISKLPGLEEAVLLMERSSRELQEQVMGLRLLQIKMAFARFPRLVHDLSSVCGKKIELRLIGEETELDKNLIEAIGDPLTHLVRNSIDHGLETPDERRAAGKSETGILSISAFHEGGSIVIDISDDGRGLDRTRILRKAIERGLVSPDENLTDEQIYQLIFQPGFSTAEQVTDLSGRGVGMDIVNQAICAIGGTVRVKSVPGRGVSTRIRLPLTMAVLEGQTMTVGDSVYIVPLTSIVESIRPRAEDIHVVAELGELVKVRQEYLPICRLNRVLSLDSAVTNPWEGSLVLVESEGRKVALMVDELLGQGQVVIKSLETNYRKVDGVAGATILGDGRVALIIDVPSLINGARTQYPAGRSAA